MKTDIHPQVHPVIFVDASSGAEFIATSTLTAKETRDIDGVKHYVIKVDVTSDTHPFYTGKQKLIDSAGRVDKFRAKMEKAKKFQAENEVKADDDNEEIAQQEVKVEEKKEVVDEKVETEVKDEDSPKEAEVEEETVEEEA